MLSHPDFSPRDWDLAPHYTSPAQKPGVVILDFEQLGALAVEEEANRSFRKTPDGTLAKAPLFVDDLPAAFYRINTAYAEVTPNHNTSRTETLVVVDGMLRLLVNDGRDHDAETPGANTFFVGDVAELYDQPVSMQAVGLIDPAQCLAVALYRDRDVMTHRDFEIVV